MKMQQQRERGPIYEPMIQQQHKGQPAPRRAFQMEHQKPQRIEMPQQQQLQQHQGSQTARPKG